MLLNKHSRTDSVLGPQQTNDVMITSSLRQDDAAASSWRNTDFIITTCVRWLDVSNTDPTLSQSRYAFYM